MIKTLLLLLFINGLFAQEEFNGPSEFEFNQSRLQSFYLYLDGNIDSIPLEEGDWIAAFNGDTCIGSAAWEGEYTALPVMGDDGSQWTVGYLEIGGTPTFKVYDVSSNTYYVASSSETYPFEDLGTWVINTISVGNDCAGTLGGIAFSDDCGVCSGGNSNHIANSDQDCQDVCFGDAYIDGCGVCVGGTTGEEACPLDCMGQLTPDDCSIGTTPGCAEYDDCGICVNGTSGNIYNQDADCLGVCFGDAIYDECGVCAGDDSSCNQPIAYYQTVNVDEDSSIDILLQASDPNGDELTFTLTSSPENGAVNAIAGSPEVVYTPNQDFNGTDSFSFTVTDGTWTLGVGLVTINVNAINDAPVLTFIDNQNVDEDGSFYIALDAFDVDGDDLLFSVSLDGNADVSLAGNQLTITPNSNFNGDIQVQVEVTDGDLLDSQDFILTVNPINDAPVLAPIEDQIINEDELFVYELEIENVDGDMIFPSAITDENFTAVFSNTTLQIAPSANGSGSGEIIITIFDGEFLSEQSFNLTVLPVNDAPVIVGINDQQLMRTRLFL